MIKTVLYAHGLESGPHGRKAQHLATAGFEVVSEQMPCGRAGLARDPVLYAIGGAGVLAVVAATKARGALGLVLSLATVGAAAPWVGSRLMRRVFRRSVAVQTRALAAHHVDAVIGSSFGGAVALELLLRGGWSGPTVLLCPAHELIADRARLASPRSLASLPDDVSAHVVVVHGRADATVPVSHSEALVAGSRAKLVLVDDDHRLSTTCTPASLAVWIAMTRGDDEPASRPDEPD